MNQLNNSSNHESRAAILSCSNEFKKKITVDQFPNSKNFPKLSVLLFSKKKKILIIFTENVIRKGFKVKKYGKTDTK